MAPAHVHNMYLLQMCSSCVSGHLCKYPSTEIQGYPLKLGGTFWVFQDAKLDLYFFLIWNGD